MGTQRIAATACAAMLLCLATACTGGEGSSGCDFTGALDVDDTSSTRGTARVQVSSGRVEERVVSFRGAVYGIPPASTTSVVNNPNVSPPPSSAFTGLPDGAYSASFRLVQEREGDRITRSGLEVTVAERSVLAGPLFCDVSD